MTSLAASLNSPDRTDVHRHAVAGLAIVMLMPSLDTSIANASLPAIARAFGATFPQVQWIVLSYLLAVTTLVVGAGRLGDIVGRRRLLLGAVAGFTTASIACGFAPSLPVLLVARAGQGVSAAAMIALTIASVADTVPADRISATMGLLGSMSAAGTALGPSIGGALTSLFGWPAIFLVNVPIGIAAFELLRRNLADAKASAQQSFDLAGTVLLGVAVGTMALAATRGSSRAFDASLLFISAAAWGAFYVVETRRREPLVPFDAMRRRSVWVGLIGAIVVSAVMMTTLVVGPFYLTRALGLTTLAAGFILSVGPVISMVTGVPAGRLVARIGARRMMIGGLGGIAGGAFSLALIPSSIGIAGYAAPIAMMTSSYAAFQAANNTVIMSSIAAEQRGAVAGLLSLSRNLGLSAGTAVMGAIFLRAAGHDDFIAAAGEHIATAAHISFAMAATLIVVPLALLLDRRHSR